MELQISESSEPAQLATRHHLFDLLSFLDKKLPDYCEVYGHVLTCLWTSDPIYKVYFSLDSKGEYTAIAGLKKDGRLNSENEMQRSWLITTWAIDKETRLKLYQSIKDINWQTDEFVFTGLNSEPHPMIAAFFASHGRILTLYKMGIYVIDRQAALAIELSSPADVYVKSLETHNAATVYDNWSYNEITTVDSVLEGVIASPTAGVFLKDTNKLVCWMTSRVHVGMSQLYTLEEYRRRGYAACVTQYLTKRLAQSGYVPYAIVSPNNEPSVRCFQRAGFRLNSLFHICEVTFPKSNSKH